MAHSIPPMRSCYHLPACFSRICWAGRLKRVQQRQPVEIAASKAAQSALLDYIYDGQPEVPVEVGLELLRLAEAYDLPKLAGEIEAVSVLAWTAVLPCKF